MTDRLDELLTHLPAETMAPDLTKRIRQATAKRQRQQQAWRLARGAALVGALVGGGLVVNAWGALAAVWNASGELFTQLPLWQVLARGPINLADNASPTLLLGLGLLTGAVWTELAQQLRQVWVTPNS